MIQSRATANRDPDQQRRDEIKGKLDEHGFGRDRRARQQAANGGELDDHAQRLRALLQTLGPVFASFGRYLGSRPDLLSLSDCVVLAGISNRASPTAAATIRQIVDAGFESQPDALRFESETDDEELASEADDRADPPRLANFAAEPFESRLLFQLHHGELENGDLVVVKVMHPAIQLEQDIQLMPLVAHAVAPRMIDANRFSETVASFQRVIGTEVDCLHTAEALTTLAHDTRDNNSLQVPRVYHELCSKHVLVTERLNGTRLDDYIATCHAEPVVDRSFSKQAIVPDELARLLCDAWLYQAFQGTMLPVDVCPENVLIRSPTEIAIVDGSFENLPAASRRNLLNYFIAVATDEPSKSLTCLAAELDATHRNISQSTLDRQFRQLVAFRDGGWEDGGRANCLSDTLFAQWRLAAGSGFRPLRHLTHFFRGTFHLAYIARQVAPDRDSLLEGVKDLRLTKLLNDIGTMMEPSYWGGQADRLASLMILGPQHLDDALKTMSSKEEPSDNPTEMQGRPKVAVSPLLLTLLVLVMVFLFRNEFTDQMAPVWAERMTAILFIAMGGVALRLLAFPGNS